MHNHGKATAAIATVTLIGGVAGIGVLVSKRATVISVSGQAAPPDTLRLTGAIRDFSNSHPDFNKAPAAGLGHYAGNVKPLLDGNRRPAFVGNGINAGGGSYEDIDLVAYWPLDDGTGVQARDTKELNHGVLIADADWVTGRYGGGVHFNGTNEYIEIPSSPEMQVTGDVTFAGWFKVDDTFTPTSPITMIILEKFLDTEHDFHIGLAGLDYNRPEVPKGALVFKVENGPTSDYYRYTWTNRTTWTAGEWYHFAAVLDSSDTSKNALFINGVDDRSPVDAGGVGFVDTDYDAPMRIGGKTIDYNGFATDIYFKGTIDDVMIFRRTVTEADFLAGTGGGFKVASQWRDDEGRPIAPHLAQSVDFTGPFGVRTKESMVLSQTTVDSFDSRNGPYGPGNSGGNAVVSTNSTATGAITIDSDAIVTGSVLVGPAGDPATSIDNTGTITGTTGTLGGSYPAPVITVPTDTEVGANLGSVTYTGGETVTIDSNRHYDDFRVTNDAVVTITGNVVILIEGNFTLENRGQIQVSPGSSLDIYAKGKIGFKTKSAWSDPANTRLYVIGDPGFTIETEAAFYGNVLAPDALLVLKTKAHVYGSFYGRALEALTESGLHVNYGTSGGVSYDTCGGVLNDMEGAAGAADSGGITSGETFSEWYYDILGTNLSAAHTITLVNDGAGVYEFFDDNFHPVDDRLLGNEGTSHNASFTFAIESSFVYEACAGQFFEFQGADDAWLFIDGKLAMDLGGIVPGTSQYASMDRLDLVDGETYAFNFFYAQRHWASSMFRVRTNLPLAQGQIVMASGGFD